jgi:hypothetical protein
MVSSRPSHCVRIVIAKHSPFAILESGLSMCARFEEGH